MGEMVPNGTHKISGRGGVGWGRGDECCPPPPKKNENSANIIFKKDGGIYQAKHTNGAKYQPEHTNGAKYQHKHTVSMGRCEIPA